MASIKHSFSYFSSVVLLFLVLATYFTLADKTKSGRTLTTVLNPGCNVTACLEGMNGSFANVAYVKAEGSTDTLHYIISSIGSLSAVVIRGKPGSFITINWEKLLSENITERDSSIILEPEKSQLENSYGVVFTRLFEYNDIEDKAKLTYYDGPEAKISTNWTVHHFSDFGWQHVSMTKKNKNSAIFNITRLSNASNDYMDESDKMNETMGTLSFVFNAYEDDDRESILPKMEHNYNNTIMDFLLNDYTIAYPNSRFALEVVLIGTDKEKPAITSTQSLDDEYTPGVFKMIDWSTHPSIKKHGGYLEWKPVCYTKLDRDRLSGTFVDYYALTDGMDQKDFLEQSVAYAFFGDKLFTSVFDNSATNLSFGLAGDGAYTKTNYTVWTTSIGYGEPPQDVISMLVIGVISAGLGLPVIIILFGGIYIFVKRHKSKSSKEMTEQ